MKPIYKPTGRAGEYGDYAINIYTGCTHGCTYCFAVKMAKRWGKDFTHVEPRKGIVDAVKRQLESDNDFSLVNAFGSEGKLIHLCFTCDPYPAGIDTTSTREVIRAIKRSGNYVQILTKAGKEATRDLDLLDEHDWFGVTITGACEQEPGAAHPDERLEALGQAKFMGINTWVSCEPVLDDVPIYALIRYCDFIDKYKIGKLNHVSLSSLGYPEINWGEFGRACECECLRAGREYVIKEDLRREMEAHHD